MIEYLNSIKINAGYFENETKLDLIEIDGDKPEDEKKKQLKKIRASLIFGKNGSGKSTISRSLYNFDSTNTDNNTISLYDFDNNIINPAIHVFNEDFINDKVKFESANDELGAIVLLGEAGDYKDELSNKRQQVNNKEEEIKKLDLENYTKPGSKKNIEKTYAELKKSISNIWAEKEKEIINSERRASVTEGVINSILKTSINESKLSTYQKELVDLIDKIKLVTDDTKLPLLLNDIKVNDINPILLKLNRVLKKDEETALSNYITETIQKHGESFIEVSNNLKADQICPICYQSVPSNQINLIVEAIKKFYSKEYEEFKNNLIESKIGLINKPELLSYAPYITNDLIDQYYSSIDAYNRYVSLINDLIEKKINNIFDAIEVNIDAKSYMKLVEELTNNLNVLNNKIKTYNDNIDNKNVNIKKAQEFNYQISAILLKKEISNYLNLKKEYESAQKKSKELESELEIINSEINTITSKMKNFNLALNEINYSLKIIFNSSKRLFLKEGKIPSQYVVYSHNKPVSLKKLSDGEKNAIAICYFFESLKENCLTQDYFKKEQLVVLDDPISSFDYENRVGIYSFFKYIFKQLLNSNENSKILIFSHELDVIFSMNKIFIDINSKSVTRNLSNKTIVNLNSVKYSIYKNMLMDVYKCGYENDDNYQIGNTTRKALEAYSNFNYLISADDFITKNQYLDTIKNEELRRYFENNMYRLVWNSSSHTQDTMHEYPDFVDFETYTAEQKKLVCKDVLAFLYCIDENHINNYFKDYTKAIANIKNRIEEIKLEERTAATS